MTSRRHRRARSIDPDRPTGWALLEFLCCVARDAARAGDACGQLATALVRSPSLSASDPPPDRQDRLGVCCGSPPGSRDGVPAEGALGHGPWRVFMSHTSDLRDHPVGRSFVAAAEAAVVRAGHAVADMAYFPARDRRSVEHCVTMLARTNVYVGIIGLHYGSPVPARPALSYTELEFETATKLGLPRLIFLVREDGQWLPPVSQSAEHGVRQEAFRSRLREADVMISTVASPTDLELALLHSLGELQTDTLERAAYGQSFEE
jgi:uncharacterized protein DUF4062